MRDAAHQSKNICKASIKQGVCVGVDGDVDGELSAACSHIISVKQLRPSGARVGSVHA